MRDRRTSDDYVILSIVPQYFEEVRRRKEELIETTMAAVRERLTKKID
jgi:hypothetical protein